MNVARGLAIVLCAAMLGLGGCAGSGAASKGGGPATGQFLILNDQLVGQIKNGVSTMDDVKGLVGSPGAVTTKKEAPAMSDDMEAWTYTAVTQTHATALVVMFKNGIVQAHSRNTQPIHR